MLGKRSNPEDSPSLYQESEDQKRTLFISNLPIGTQEEDVLALFGEGNPVLATIKDIRIVNRSESDQSKVYIDFSSYQECLEAKKINGKIIGGRKLYVDISKPPEKADNKNTLHIRNLPFGMTEDEVLSGLKVDRKDLLDVRFKKGFCFI